MASILPASARSRKSLKLSSIHTGKRAYPKPRPPDLQLQLSQSPSITAMLSPSSPHILPKHSSPTSPKFHRRRTSLSSLSSLSLPWIDIPVPQSRTFWIVLCFSLNFSLTLCNKVVLNNFPFPYTITAFHALAGWVGTRLTIRPRDRPPTLGRSEFIVLASFSVIYTLNIVVSNVSLKLVTVPFHQVVRASSPFFTLVLSALLLRIRITNRKLISLIPVVAGVGLATYGDYYYTLSGFLLTLLGTFLASLKSVITNILQSPHLHLRGLPPPRQDTSHSRHPRVRFSKSSSLTTSPSSPSLQHQSENSFLVLLSSIPKLNLTPIQLLYLLSPLAFIQCALLAFYFGEFDKISTQITQLRQSPAVAPLSGNHTDSNLFTAVLNRSGATGGVIGAGAHVHGLISVASLSTLLPGLLGLCLNACMAFALNVVSFHTNRRVGALEMSVAANVKQVLTVLASVVLFNLTITKMNAAGVLLTLVGGALYARVDLEEKRQRVK